MTASAKPVKPTAEQQTHQDQDAPALPGVLFLLKDSLFTVWNLRVTIYGYTAWLLIPTALYLFAQGIPSPAGDYLLILQSTLALILSLWVTAAIMLYVAVVASKEEDQNVNYAALGKRAWDKALPLFIIQVFTVCLVMFGTILFAIPGILAWIWTAFAMQEAVLGNRSVSQAFKNSYQLVKGRFFAIFWRLFVSHCIFVLAVMLGFGAYVAAGLYGSAAGMEATLSAWPPWMEIGLSLVALPLTPVMIVFNLLLYFAAKRSYSGGENHESKV